MVRWVWWVMGSFQEEWNLPINQFRLFNRNFSHYRMQLPLYVINDLCHIFNTFLLPGIYEIMTASPQCTHIKFWRQKSFSCSTCPVIAMHCTANFSCAPCRRQQYKKSLFFNTKIYDRLSANGMKVFTKKEFKVEKNKVKVWTRNKKAKHLHH